MIFFFVDSFRAVIYLGMEFGEREGEENKLASCGFQNGYFMEAILLH